MKAGPQLRERVRVLMHLNGRVTKVSLERTEGSGMADGGITWDIPTDDIPVHLRAIGSRFVVVTTMLRPEAGDTAEQGRPGRQQDHERRRTLPSAELMDRRRQLRRQGDRSRSAAGGRQRPPRAVEGELELLRRPKRKFAADVHYDFGNGLDLSVDGLAASERADFCGNTLHGYALINLAAGWNFHPGWREHLRGSRIRTS